MKVLTVFLAFVALLTLTSCGDDFDAEAEQATLEALSTEYYDAYMVQDMEVHRRIESEDWTGYYGFPDWQGISVVDATTYDPDPSLIGTKITIRSREWMISSELAVSKSREAWYWPGETLASHYLLTMVWEKRDGQWKHVHHHMSEYTP